MGDRAENSNREFQSSEPLAPAPPAGRPGQLGEACFERIFERSALGILIVDGRGLILESNPAFQKMSGYSASELRGEQSLSLWTPEDAAAEAALFARMRRGELEEFELEKVLRCKPGNFRTVTCTVSVLAPSSDDGLQLMVLLSDVTEHRRADQEVRHKEAMLEEAQAIAHLGSFDWDLRTRKLEWTNETYRIYGLPLGSPLSFERWLALLRPGERQAAKQGIERVIHSHETFCFEHHIRLPDGRERTVQARVRASLDDSGQAARLVGTAQDVTHRREVERAKDEFLAIASHELRTPLSSIRASLRMLVAGEAEPGSQAAQALLALAMNNTERMVRLVNDILDMERLAHGRLSLSPAATNTLSLLRHAADVLALDAQAAGVTLALSGEPLPLLADPDRMVQVLTNLIDNALEFSPRGSTVRLTSERHGDEAWLGVTDEGPGLTPEQQAIVFERFRQLEPSSTRRKQGLGLGLPISRAIAEQHGGRLWVESAPGRGASFRVALPLATPGGTGA